MFCLGAGCDFQRGECVSNRRLIRISTRRFLSPSPTTTVENFTFPKGNQKISFHPKFQQLVSTFILNEKH